MNNSTGVLDFSRVSAEIHSLVTRRRELLIFLGSLFAGMGLYLQNILEGKLPASLGLLEKHAFASFAVGLYVPSLLLALRLAKLHAGMIINGVFYAKIRREELSPGYAVEPAGRLNWAGVSVQFFLIAACLSSLAAALIALSLLGSPIGALGAFSINVVALVSALVYFHSSAYRFASSYVATATVEKVTQEEHEDHLAESLRQTNHDMLACLTMTGLVIFTVFQALTGLNEFKTQSTELSLDSVKRFGPIAVAAPMAFVGLTCGISYLRLMVALGRFSVELDPTDRPFRPFRLTDSLLGYLMLSFLSALAAGVSITAAFAPDPARLNRTAQSADFGSIESLTIIVVTAYLAIATAIYFAVVAVCAKRFHRR